MRSCVCEEIPSGADTEVRAPATRLLVPCVRYLWRESQRERPGRFRGFGRPLGLAISDPNPAAAWVEPLPPLRSHPASALSCAGGTAVNPRFAAVPIALSTDASKIPFHSHNCNSRWRMSAWICSSHSAATWAGKSKGDW